MKKVLLAVVAGAFCVPAFAEEMQNAAPVEPNAQPVAQDFAAQRPEAFKQARENHRAQMKATQEKVNKLVAEYNKLKPGKKKDAKKAEITAFVASIRDEQINFQEKQLAGFEKRLNHMKEVLAEQKTEDAKKTWIDSHAEKLIAENGDLRVLFDRPKGVPGMGNMPGKGNMRGGKFGSHKGAMRGPVPGRGAETEEPLPQPGPVPPPPPVEK